MLLALIRSPTTPKATTTPPTVTLRSISTPRALNNTATGFAALYRNTTGNGNTANGFQALYGNTTGLGNTANGFEALYSNTIGGSNTATGILCARWQHQRQSITRPWARCAGQRRHDRQITLFVSAQTPPVRTSATGPIFLTSVVFAQAPAAGIEFVTVRLSDGKLGHNASSRRYKEDIKPMGDASEVLYKLKPVTFKFKEQDVDPKKGIQPQNLDYGLIAEDVAEIDPELAIRDGKGQIESLRYIAIYNMMLNEFIKERRKVEQQDRKLEQQEATIDPAAKTN